MEEDKIIRLNPLTLAFLGDAVYSLFVRARAVESMDVLPNEINAYCTKFVKASAQARAYRMLEPELTEEERGIAHRARNAHPANKAKNATRGDYMHATAFEAVLGYLYLSGADKRLETLEKKAMEIQDE